MPSKPSNIRQPKLHERHVFEFIKKQNEPVSYHEIQKSLEDTMSSGAYQGAVKRCLQSGANFRIYEGKKISEKKDRLIRVFSVNPSKVFHIPDVSELHKLYQKVMSGNVFKLENNYILPLNMDERITQILMQLVKKSSNLESIGDLFSKALMKYLKESVSEGLIDQAKQKVEENRN